MAVAAHHFFEARLVNGNAATIERVDLRLVFIDTHHIIAVLGETGAQHETDVTGSDNGYFHRQ